jgi:transposase
MSANHGIKNLHITSKVENGYFLGNRIHYHVFYQNVPVASFYEKDLPSEKIAAIHLVESGLTTINEAAKIVGLHRNTISKALINNRKFGIRYVIKDNRGPKGPFRYPLDIKAYIINLLKKLSDCSDIDIAKKASKEFKTKISRREVSRIRTALKMKTRTKRKRSKSDISASLNEGCTKTNENWRITTKKKVKKIYF